MRSLILIFLFTAVNLLAKPAVNVTVDRSSVTLNTVFTLTFEFQDFDEFPSFTPDLRGDFTIISGPTQSTNYSWINGVSSSTKKKSWSIAALKTGNLQIPSYEFRYKGSRYRTRTINIRVSDPRQESASSDEKQEAIFIRSELSSREAVAGEVISLKYRLYYRTKVINYSFDPIRSLPGFLVDEQKQKKNPSVQSEIINGVPYNTAVLKEVLLVPTQAGEHTISPQRVRLEVQRNSSRRSIFDDPFFSNFNTQSVDLLTESLTINVMDLPAGAPPGFSGAVGEFELDASLDTNSFEADQAVNMIIQVKGKGNLKNFSFKTPEFPDGFQVFDPRMTENIRAVSETYSGSKIWEFIFIPTEDGIYELPTLEFTYYNSRLRRYITLEHEFDPIEVLPNSRIIQDLQKGLTQQEVALLNEDIRYIYSSENAELVELHDNVWRQPGVWGFPLLSFLAVLLHFLYELYFRIRMNDPAVLRFRNAYRNAEKALRAADDTDLPQRSRIINNYFTDKFNLRAGELSGPFLEKKLLDKKVDPELIKRAVRILQIFDELKFSPAGVSGPEELESRHLDSFLKAMEAEI